MASMYYSNVGVSSRATGSVATLNATSAPLHRPDLSLFNRGALTSSYNRTQPKPDPGDPGGDGPLLRVVDQINVQVADATMPTPDLSLYNRGALTSSYNRVQPRPEPSSEAYRQKVFNEHFEVGDPKHDELHVPNAVIGDINNLTTKGFSREFVESFLMAVKSGQRHNLTQPQLEILDKLMSRHISAEKSEKKAEEKKEKMPALEPLTPTGDLPEELEQEFDDILTPAKSLTLRDKNLIDDYIDMFGLSDDDRREMVRRYLEAVEEEGRASAYQGLKKFVDAAKDAAAALPGDFEEEKKIPRYITQGMVIDNAGELISNAGNDLYKIYLQNNRDREPRDADAFLRYANNHKVETKDALDLVSNGLYYIDTSSWTLRKV